VLKWLKEALPGKQNSLTPGSNISISTTDPLAPVISAITIQPDVNAADGQVADAKLTAGMIAEVARATHNRGKVISAYTPVQVWSMLGNTVTAAGAGYEVGDSLQYGLDLEDVLLVVTAVGASGEVTAFTVSANGASDEDPGTGDYSFVGGHGTGFVLGITFEQTTGTVLADVPNPQPNDTVRVVLDEIHSGQTWDYVYADYNGDLIYNWVSLAIAGSSRNFYSDPIERAEIAAKAVVDSKVDDHTTDATIVESDTKFLGGVVYSFTELKRAIVAKINALFTNKLDKVTSTATLERAYIVKPDGEQGLYPIDQADATPDTLALRGSYGEVKTGTPYQDADAANKKYVDDATATKVDKSTGVNKVYGTDDSGAQTTFDRKEFLGNKIYVDGDTAADTWTIYDKELYDLLDSDTNSGLTFVFKPAKPFSDLDAKGIEVYDVDGANSIYLPIGIQGNDSGVAAAYPDSFDIFNPATFKVISGMAAAVDYLYDDRFREFIQSVDGVDGEGSRNVQLTRVYDTLEDFEADKDNIPNGARVVKLYEYPDNLAGVMVVPDYANMEATDLWDGGTSPTPITVTRTGFYQVWGTVTHTTLGDGQSGIWITINGKTVNSGYRSGAVVGNYTSTPTQVVFAKKGDVFACGKYANSSYISTHLFYIPPLLVAKELPVVVEKNGSYSLDEIKTADTWIDGKPIYKRTFQGVVTVAANTWLIGYVAGSIGTGVDTVVEIKGSFDRGNNQWLPIIMTDYNADSSVKQASFTIAISDGSVLWNSYMSIARTNSPYYITVYYTKATS
jgi:hypothetical protein